MVKNVFEICFFDPFVGKDKTSRQTDLSLELPKLKLKNNKMTEDHVTIRKRFLLLFTSIQVIKIAHFFTVLKSSSVGGSQNGDEVFGFSTIAFWCLVDGSFFLTLRRLVTMP